MKKSALLPVLFFPLCYFFPVPADAIIEDVDPPWICEPASPDIGQYYYVGDADNSLAPDAEYYLNNRYDLGIIQSQGNYVDMDDVMYLLRYLFFNGPAPQIAAAADANSDRRLDLADAIRLLTYSFLNGEAPGNGELKVTYSQQDGIDTVNHIMVGEDLRMTLAQRGVVYTSSGVPFRRVEVAYRNVSGGTYYWKFPLVTVIGPYKNPLQYGYHALNDVCPDGTPVHKVVFYLPDHPQAVAFVEVNEYYSTAPFFVTFQGYGQLPKDFPVYSPLFMGGGGSIEDDCGNGNGNGMVVDVQRIECPEWMQDQPPPLDLSGLGDDYPDPPPPSPPPSCTDIPLPGPVKDALDALNGASDALEGIGISFGGGPDGAVVGLNETGLVNVGQGVAAGAGAIASGCATAYHYCSYACVWLGSKVGDAAKAAADGIASAANGVANFVSGLWK